MDFPDSLLLDSQVSANAAASRRLPRGESVTVVRLADVSRMLLTPQEAAWLLSISEKTLDHLVRTKKLKSKKIGRLRRYRVADLQKFAAAK